MHGASLRSVGMVRASIRTVLTILVHSVFRYLQIQKFQS